MVKEELMINWKQRTELLLGEDKMARLQSAHVLVVGLGGVGAYAAEMICRAGVGRMTIVDADTVQITNLNRQLPAMHSTLGMFKADVLEARFKDINPDLELKVLPVFLKDENIPDLLDADEYDFIVIDCPPALGMLTVNAMTAANTVLVPIQCEYYALEGLSQLIRTINLVKQKLNPELEIEGVVFTMYDARTNLCLMEEQIYRSRLWKMLKLTLNRQYIKQ